VKIAGVQQQNAGVQFSNENDQMEHQNQKNDGAEDNNDRDSDEGVNNRAIFFHINCNCGIVLHISHSSLPRYQSLTHLCHCQQVIIMLQRHVIPLPKAVECLLQRH